MVRISTPDLTDQCPAARAIELQFNNYGAVRQFAGPAVTIKCHEDNSLVKALVEETGKGRVIVVDGGGSLRRALLGDMLAEKAATNGWAGLVHCAGPYWVTCLLKRQQQMVGLGW